jgi:ABC-type lipoprotein export system ATPase subunit
VIKIENVTKTYKMGKVEVHALRGVSLHVDKGEWVTIMGPSGSGKSTLMNIIGCLDVPTTGSYWLDDIEVSSLSENELASIRNQQMGFVFQTFNLLARTSALKQVMLPMQYSRNGRRLPYAVREARAAEALETVGLGHRLDHQPTELSGGQQQRVAIARALVNEPSIVLADEPTGNLDSKSGEEVMEVFHRMHEEREITVVIVTHDEGIAAHAQRMIHLHDGRITEE